MRRLLVRIVRSLCLRDRFWNRKVSKNCSGDGVDELAGGDFQHRSGPLLGIQPILQNPGSQQASLRSVGCMERQRYAPDGTLVTVHIGLQPPCTLHKPTPNLSPSFAPQDIILSMTREDIHRFYAVTPIWLWPILWLRLRSRVWVRSAALSATHRDRQSRSGGQTFRALSATHRGRQSRSGGHRKKAT